MNNRSPLIDKLFIPSTIDNTFEHHWPHSHALDRSDTLSTQDGPEQGFCKIKGIKEGGIVDASLPFSLVLHAVSRIYPYPRSTKEKEEKYSRI